MIADGHDGPGRDPESGGQLPPIRPAESPEGSHRAELRHRQIQLQHQGDCAAK